jgi:hypothetical protein
MHAVPLEMRRPNPELGPVVRARTTLLAAQQPLLGGGRARPGSAPLGQCLQTQRRGADASFCLALASLLAQVNIAPQTRKERQAALFRDDLEKMRLGQRRESYYVYEEGGVTPQPDSLSYIADADRFVTDGVALNKMERDAAVNKKEQMFYNRRMVRSQNEEVRWRTIETQHQMEQRRLEEMRENHSFARANKTSMPYNPINLRYDDGHDGERLRYSDESLRYRGALRAEHLQRRMTSTGYDPITGAPIERVHVPEAPKRPGQ